jgi:thymidylate synthase
MRQQTLLAAPGKKNIIIVGHTTFKTLPPKFYAEPTRQLYILSKKHQEEQKEQNLIYHSCPEALYLDLMDRYYKTGDIDRVFVFGGGEIYKIFLEKRWIHTFHMTTLDTNYTCDTFFPMALLMNSGGAYEVVRTCAPTLHSTLTIWARRPHPEYAYLALLQKVYYTGQPRETRNGGAAADTRSIFGAALEFDVAQFGFPLLTTKKMFFKGIAEELCWFLKADTDAHHLQEKGVHIWDGNTSRTFLDQLGLTDYAEGQAGPIYGYQWRNFNGPYNKEEGEGGGQVKLEVRGRDQLYACLQLLQKDPFSRRILFSGWNPQQLSDMCLPPCHVLYQFYVSADKQTLSCQMYQRSADLFLGLPFNIASTALLTSIFARLTNLSVGTIRINIGDAHIYGQHHECVRQQLTRTPLPFCQLGFQEQEKKDEKEEKDKPQKKLEDFTLQDFVIHNYVSHGVLKAPMIA